MRKNKKAKYVFRGTTIGWQGNIASRQLPRTPTTTNPIKALLFAICCGIKGVIYIAEVRKLKFIKADKNVLAKVEEEIGYIISPTDFILLSEGYITINDAMSIVNELKIELPIFLDKSLLDFALKNTSQISDATIEQFYLLSLPFLKNT